MSEPACANSADEKARESVVYRDYYTQEMFDWWVTHPYRRHTLRSFDPYLAQLNSVGARLVEFGSGAGVNLTLISSGYPNVACFGFDLSPEGTRVGTKYGRGRFWRGDAERVALSKGCADAVLLISVLHHFWRNPDRLIAEVDRVLRPGGYLFVADPNATRITTRRGRVLSGIALRLVDAWTRARGKRIYQVQIPESDTEQPITPDNLRRIVERKFSVERDGFSEWVTFLARHHEVGFAIALAADAVLKLLGRRHMNLYYLVARKRNPC